MPHQQSSGDCAKVDSRPVPLTDVPAEFGIQLTVSDDSGILLSDLKRAAAGGLRTTVERATDVDGLPLRAWEVNMVGDSAVSVTRRMETFARGIGVDFQALSGKGR